MILNTGTEIVHSRNGLLTTVCYQFGDAPTVYALEGSIAMAGASVQWLRDNLGLIQDASETEALAQSVDDSGGCYFVPAFMALSHSYWRSDARRRHRRPGRYINVRPTSCVYAGVHLLPDAQVLDAMNADSGRAERLKVDGGATANNFLMQLQADILGAEVIRPQVAETTSLGAAYAAGLAVGFWPDESLRANWQTDRVVDLRRRRGRRGAAGWCGLEEGRGTHLQLG
ncbi:MAG: FGGY-family carbohydrate kinase [Caldilineaceae bacterium]